MLASSNSQQQNSSSGSNSSSSSVVVTDKHTHLLAASLKRRCGESPRDNPQRLSKLRIDAKKKSKVAPRSCVRTYLLQHAVLLFPRCLLLYLLPVLFPFLLLRVLSLCLILLPCLFLLLLARL